MTLSTHQLHALAQRMGLSHDAVWSQLSLGDAHEHRPVIRIEVEGKPFVARRLEAAGVAPRFGLMRELFRHAAAPLGIPEPLAVLASEGWIVERWIAAEPAPRVVGRRDGPRHARRIGKALGTLHRLPLRPAAPRTLADHVNELIYPHPHRLVEAIPERAALIRGALGLLLERSVTWPALPIAPLHRDFHLRQLLVDEERIWVVDWDTFAWGDPFFDVAYFTTYLENHLEPKRVPQWSEAFLDGYGAERDAEIEERLAVYRVFNHLRRACRRFRRRDADWRTRLDASLDAVERDLRALG